MRARITKELIEKKGFNIIAVEADWPDATSINHYIHGISQKPQFTKKPFSDFPGWMWANHSVLYFTHWLKDYNQRIYTHRDGNTAGKTISFYGIDFYNIFSSMEAVLDYLQQVDPKAAEIARLRYDCLMPWTYDPSSYSHLIKSRKHSGCENEVREVLQNLRNKRPLYVQADKQRYFNAEQNARLIKNGERFYRTRTDANNNTRNERDQNMFDTLLEILNHHGKTSKAVVWAHNSHIGDARATEMSAHGESNLGQLVRETFGDSAYLVGFGTDHGTVSAASEWRKPVKVMRIQPSHRDSYERLFHEVKADNFLLPLRTARESIREKLLAKRLERAIGTSYDPKDELNKHYFHASLPHQFDEYIWFDKTRAVKPLNREAVKAN
jgi:protein-L-isoaspartate(D-aspartate) O-methyltransferase